MYGNERTECLVMFFFKIIVFNMIAHEKKFFRLSKKNINKIQEIYSKEEHSVHYIPRIIMTFIYSVL